MNSPAVHQGLPFFVCLVVFVSLFLVVAYLQGIVKMRLKKYHPENPNAGFLSLSLSASGSVGRGVSFIRFVWKNEYRCLNDSRLTSYCAMLKVAQVCYLVVFVAVAILIFVPT